MSCPVRCPLPAAALLLARAHRHVDRRAGKLELLAQAALDEPDVPGVEWCGGEQHEPGRTGAGLRGEEHARGAPAAYRVRGLLHQRGEELVEPSGRYPPGPVLQRGAQRGSQLVDGPAGLRRHVEPKRPWHPAQVALQLATQLVAPVVVDEVPLVERDDQGAAGLGDHRDDPLVLLADRHDGVEQHDRHLGRLDRGGGAQARVVLGAAGLPHPLAQAGGVDELPHLAADGGEAVDRVDGGAGDRVDDRALLLGQAVEQAGLADVGPADQGHPARAARPGRAGGLLRQRGEDGVEQVAGAAPVQRRHRLRLPQTQRPQHRRVRLLAGVVDLVGDEHDGLAAAAQHADRGLVVVERADRGVDHEEHDVCGMHGGLGLRGDRLGPLAGVGYPAAGVDDLELAAGPQGVVGHPVAGHAGHVLHDGLPAPDDPVDERGLADVGPADNCDDRDRLLVILVIGVLEVVFLEVVLVEVLVLEIVVFGLDAVVDGVEVDVIVNGVEVDVVDLAGLSRAHRRVACSTSRVSWATTSSMPSSVLSSTTASSARRSGSAARLESTLSRRASSATVTARSAPFSPLRRRPRSVSDAVRYTFRSASGATTVPMSRPSTTMHRAASMISRCWATSRARTAGTAATADTAAVTSALRIGPSTGVSSTAKCGAAGSVPTCTVMLSATLATASASEGSIPSRRTAQVTARYIAPVSRYCAPSAVARRRETVDLPDPDGPSTATTQGWSLTLSRLRRVPNIPSIMPGVT